MSHLWLNWLSWYTRLDSVSQMRTKAKITNLCLKWTGQPMHCTLCLISWSAPMKLMRTFRTFWQLRDGRSIPEFNWLNDWYLAMSDVLIDQRMNGRLTVWWNAKSTDWRIRQLTDGQTAWLTYWRPNWLTDWLADHLQTYWLIEWLADWLLTDWLTDELSYQLTYRLTNGMTDRLTDFRMYEY